MGEVRKMLTASKSLIEAIEADLDDVVIIGLKGNEFCYWTSNNEAPFVLDMLHVMEECISDDCEKHN